jgi:hypothetical protein
LLNKNREENPLMKNAGGFRTVGEGEICHLVSSVNKNQQDLSSPLCLMLLKGQLTIIVGKIVM